MTKVRDMVIFLTLVYSQSWMSCEKAVDAPSNDLKFVKCLLQYELIQPVIAKSALKAIQKNQWYLAAEMIPLCLFSDAVENDHKRAVADALLAKMTKKGTLLPKARFGTRGGVLF